MKAEEEDLFTEEKRYVSSAVKIILSAIKTQQHLRNTFLKEERFFLVVSQVTVLSTRELLQ